MMCSISSHSSYGEELPHKGEGRVEPSPPLVQGEGVPVPPPPHSSRLPRQGKAAVVTVQELVLAAPLPLPHGARVFLAARPAAASGEPPLPPLCSAPFVPPPPPHALPLGLSLQLPSGRTLESGCLVGAAARHPWPPSWHRGTRSPQAPGP